ncbi:MAG: YtxH domain-containing protein [Chloroflexi bacterium]|nr:YtxH domain-containing protein [Chloroflexota bacterium]
MRMSGVLFGVAVGATLMYLFDPRQGVERREVWGERVRKGREQAQSAVETGRSRVSEYRHRNDNDDDVDATLSSVASNGDSADA